MNSSKAISAGVRRYWASQPRGLGWKELQARTPEGTCPLCGDACKRRSPSKDSKRKRLHGDFFKTCGSPDCKVAWFRYWRRDQRAKARAESEAFSRVMEAAR